MSRELRPRWDGVGVVDEKMCPVRGKGQWFHLAVEITGEIMIVVERRVRSTEAASFWSKNER